MLGEQVGITTGKRLVRRVLSTDPLTAEVSFEDSGTLYGVAVSGMGTYTSVRAPSLTRIHRGKGGKARTFKFRRMAVTHSEPEISSARFVNRRQAEMHCVPRRTAYGCTAVHGSVLAKSEASKALEVKPIWKKA